MIRLQHITPIEHGLAAWFDPADNDALATAVGEFLESEGYELADGSPGNGLYKKGNDLKRRFTGSLHMAYEFSVRIDTAAVGEASIVKIIKGPWIGTANFRPGCTFYGPLGVWTEATSYLRVKKEIERLQQAAQARFEPAS